MGANDNHQSAERWLDTALKHYGEAEPRPGLENRILANLHVEEARLALRTWWGRPVAAMIAIFVLVAGAWLPRRKPDIVPATIATQPSVANANIQPEQPIASTTRPSAALKSHGGARLRNHVARSSSGPRMDQFPTPAPLSDQEQMLARYVREHRRQATMVARARAELLKTELLRFQQAPAASDLRDSEQ